jgi:HlyD family secretion protein
VWKWFLIAFVLLAAICGTGGWWLYSSGKLESLQQQFRPDMKPTTVRLEQVAKGNLIRTINAPGVIEPKTKVLVSAQVAARIIALPFDEGDAIKKGDVIVRLDARDLQANLDSAKAALKSEEARLEGAKAAFANASTELGRKRELAASKDISKAELDLAETDYERATSNLRVAEFSIDIAKANISRAEKDLDNSVITAPLDGAVIKRNAEVGELVMVGTLNNAASVIMEIADLSVMQVKAKVDEANVAPVKAGQKARVFFNAFTDKSYGATVERVQMQRQIDRDGTAYFETEMLLEVPEGETLYWGMTCNADIEVEIIHDVLKVPSQSVVDRPVDELPATLRGESQFVDRNKKFARVVYQVIDEKAITVPVSIGPSDLTHTVIIGGLEAGTTIVTGPYKSLLSLKEGQRVMDETKVPKKIEKKEESTPVAGR